MQPVVLSVTPPMTFLLVSSYQRMSRIDIQLHLTVPLRDLESGMICFAERSTLYAGTTFEKRILVPGLKGQYGIVH